MQTGSRPRSRQGRRIRKAEQRLGDEADPRGREARSLSAPRGGPPQQGFSQRSSSAPRTRPARSKRRSGQRCEGRTESSASSENESSAHVGPWAAFNAESADLDAVLVGAASNGQWDDVLGFGGDGGAAQGPVQLLRQGRTLHRKHTHTESFHRTGEGMGQGWCGGLEGAVAERCSTHEDRDIVGRMRGARGQVEERECSAAPRAELRPGASRNQDEFDAGFEPIPISAMLQSSTAPKVIRYSIPSEFEAPCLPSLAAVMIPVFREGNRH
jgi:hypothetical protein